MAETVRPHATVPTEDNEAIDISITASSLLRSLRGVAVATKAPQDLCEPLLHCITRLSARSDAVAPVLSVPDDTENGHGEIFMAANEWRNTLNSDIHEWNNDATVILNLALVISILRDRSRQDKNISSEGFDWIWSLIYGALTNTRASKLKFTASRSAQGFLAVPLCSLLTNGKIDELFRFHVWLPDGNRGTKEVAIHAHQPFAQSWILAGRGTDCVFNVDVPDGASQVTHAKYIPRWTNNTQSKGAYVTHQISSTVTSTGALVRVSPKSEETHTRNMSYVVPQGVYHLSVVKPTEFHATLFFFDSHRGFVEDAAAIGPMESTEYTQLRDSAGVTPLSLAEMADSVRSWEKSRSVSYANPDNHYIVQSYWRYWHGQALLHAGQREEALTFFDSPDGCTPLQAFCREPTEKHRRYIQELITAGANLDALDDEGYTALDYAVLNNDIATQLLIQDGLRQRLDGGIESKLRRRMYEAEIRKSYRPLVEHCFRPILRSPKQHGLKRLRYSYARALEDSEDKRSKFDGLRYIRYSDFRNSVRLPRFSDGNVRTFSANELDDNPDHIVFLSYRWIHKDAVTGKTAPDDKDHTQFKRMHSAMAEYIKLNPSINLEKLGIWLDSSCIDRKDPMPGIAALPLTLSLCDALITLVDDLYWERAWCSVEAFMIQILRDSYHSHVWYEHIEVKKPGNGERSEYVLQEAPLDLKIDMSKTKMTWEEDRPKILFLERQARLLGA